jgi:hypothetical protein
MAQVRGHYRKNGSYVRSHTRRTRPTAPSASRPAAYTPPISRPQPVQAGPTTRVRSYVRADGVYVRSHGRRISAPVVAAAGGGGGLLLLILVLLALSGGGTGSSSAPGSRPATHITAPVTSEGHPLSR